MKFAILLNHPVKKLLFAIGLLLLLFLGMEYWRASIQPSEENQRAEINQSLNEASDLFHSRQQQLIDQTDELADRLQAQILQGSSRPRLHETVDAYDDFWGTVLFREDEPIVWNNFAPVFTENDLQDPDDDITLSIERTQNVVYWQLETGFSLRQDTSSVIPFQLKTSSRIDQSNALPIGGDSDYSLSHELDDMNGDITFSFFNNLPDDIQHYRVLSTPSQDSVGVVFATPPDIQAATTKWENQNWFWRSLFILLCFVVLSIIFSQWGHHVSSWSELMFQLTLIGIGWLVFYLLDIPTRWISEAMSSAAETTDQQTYNQLGIYLRDALFLLLIAISVFTKLKKETFHIPESRFLSALFIGLTIGVGNLSAILGTIFSAYQQIAHHAIPVLDLNILPSYITLLFYCGIGIAFFSVGLTLFSINRFVLESGENYFKIISVVIAISFFIALLMAQIIIPESIRLNWATRTTFFAFVIIYLLTLAFTRKTHLFSQFSMLRSIVLTSTLISIVAIPVIYNAYLQRQDTNLEQQAIVFAPEEDEDARELTSEILNELQQTLNGISSEDLDVQRSFLQVDFISTIQSVIYEEEPPYALDLQLIKPSGELVANYSTDLSSPGWVNIFNLRRLTAALEIEQISKSTNRPIVQKPQLRNQDQYETFYRGWIPIFGSDEQEPIAWILGSVYQERPNFNKPLRAVMASLNYDNWQNSFSLYDYRDRQLYASSLRGVSSQYPIHNRLRSSERQAIEQDSTAYYTESGSDHNYRNYLWNMGNDRIIKATSIIPDLRNILFSFFRLSFFLIAVASITLIALPVKKKPFLGNQQQFQHRILDNFMLATLFFLVLLIFASHYAIKQQNREIVEQDLFEKLESLTRSAETAPLFSFESQTDASSSLDQWVAPLNVDAAYYADRQVTSSTTPQIYRQHLIPETIPFTIYNELFEVQQRNALMDVTLGNQQLLIGYRSILSDDGTPQAAIAIPTFTESPKYNQQLLEITSYLIVLYLLVFSIFILGTAFIARQLTKPLNLIQQGLDKISKGNLDTQIPVTSSDEIGQLADAYNTMISKLKQLQKELAAAEREAAWKEMAQQVAHEIKNPLTPMKLNAQHLKRQLKSGETNLEVLKPKIEKITQNIIDQIESLNNIASDFSKFSQPLDEEFTDIAINPILTSISELYNSDDDIRIITELDRENPVVPGIADELRRVLINLIKNAFEAMPRGGTITLRSNIQNSSVFLEIEDEGIGIDEDDKSKIFVPNFSTKSSGTGLGLAISKKIIEAHDGSISFASIKNEGTTFIIKLPLNH